MPPISHKRVLRVALAAVITLLATMPAGASAAPRVKAAYAVDRDRDGRVDSVSLRWSDKVRGGRDKRAPFAFSVRGYRVTGVAPATGRRQRIRLAERSECDTGGSVRLAFRPAGRGVSAVRPRGGRGRPRAHLVDMTRFDSPFPRITCAETFDADGDAHVDGVRVTYSRAVRSRAQRGGRFLFSVAGYRVRAVDAARGRFVRIRLGESEGPDSAATPAVSYARPTRARERRYAIRAGRRGPAFAGTFQGTRDGVSPRLVSGRTGDTDVDGLLDSMALRFSEPVRGVSAATLGVLGMTVKSAAAGGNNVTLSLAEGVARGDAHPSAWIAADGITDAAGNAAIRGAIGAADGAPPVMVAAITRDTGGEPGRIDALDVSFSEPVAHARDAGGQYAFLVGDRRVSSVEAGIGTTVRLRLAEGSAPDSGQRPSVRHIPGAGLPVLDAAGNAAAQGLVNATDGVAPVLLSAVTGDSDSDGRLDATVLTFSENVLHAPEPVPASFEVTGHQLAQAGAASGDQVPLALSEAAEANSGSRPAVSYRRDGVEDIRDAAGNATPDSVVQARDGAQPILLAAATADADDDGRLDRVATTWSEPIVHDDDAAAPFAVSASGAGVARVHRAEGPGLTIDLVEPGSHDTGSTPTLTYAGGSEPIRDASGLEPAKRSWPGLTRDALAPRLVSATTSDGNRNGSLDAVSLRFSETVIHDRETAPGSFGVVGLTVTSAEAADGDVVELKLQESGSGDSGFRPAVAYVPDGHEDVRDASANLALGGTILVASDGARPVLMFAATADADDDGRLDRVATTWSEPLDHADDTSAPFPLSAEQLAVARVRAAVGATLDVDLTEPDSPDTGSAPDLSYEGGADPVRDASGLEAAAGAYPGLTRDALPPRLVATRTSDQDYDGKLDGVEFEWSEEVIGAPATGPFTVSGRTLAASVVFSGRLSRLPFSAEAAQHDTDATPVVSYDAAAGDLSDIAEGSGDMAEDAPAVGPRAALDAAAPILVAARTADLSAGAAPNEPNGTIDAVLVTFSEPISHAVDGIAPFSLNVAGRAEREIDGDAGPADRTLGVKVAEVGSPDGGETPDIAVVSAGPVPDRIRDRAPAPNEARAMTFTNTTDEVRPVLMAAQLGERDSAGACTTSAVAGIDGKVDCVLATWSEEVSHAADTEPPYSISSSGWPIATGGIGALPRSRTLDVPLAPSTASDRDRAGTTVSYDDAIDTPVLDAASPPNESLAGTKSAGAACKDTGLEGNDVRDPANPELDATAPTFQRKCAFDDDWYTVRTAAGGNGYLELLTRPSSGLAVEFALFDAGGNPVPPTEEAEEAGGVQRRKYTGLAADSAFHVRVTADETPAPQEGPYCLVFSDHSSVPAGCGPLVGQIVFTEVGFGVDKFVEIKNDFDVPVEMEGAGAKLVLGEERRECVLQLPTASAQSTIEPDEHVIVEQSPSATTFGCDQIASLSPGGERVELSANGAIDVVDFAGILASPVASRHSLQFVEDDLTKDGDANNSVGTRWCRTFAAHSKGTVGDGCDEFRLNEILWRPALSASGSEGRAFVELAGNLPALADSRLLGSWVFRGVNGLTGNGSPDFVLPSNASPRANGTYVIADAAADGSTQVANADVTWENLNLNSTLWPDSTGEPGPRGLQLLHPEPAGAPPCEGSADAFGWTTTAQGFTAPLDDLRSCPALEGQEYTTSTVGVSAARDNLSSDSDVTYNVANDTGDNRLDFCAQTTPNPGQLNIRPDC